MPVICDRDDTTRLAAQEDDHRNKTAGSEESVQRVVWRFDVTITVNEGWRSSRRRQIVARKPWRQSLTPIKMRPRGAPFFPSDETAK